MQNMYGWLGNGALWALAFSFLAGGGLVWAAPEAEAEHFGPRMDYLQEVEGILPDGWALPDDPAILTQADFERQKRLFYTALLKEATRRAGGVEPAMEPELFALFDDMAGRLADAPGKKSARHILEQVEALREKGCEDPGLLYCEARLLQSVKRGKEAKPIHVRAGALMAEGNAPFALQALNAQSAAFTFSRNTKGRAEWETKAIEYAARAMGEDAMTRDQMRVWLHACWDDQDSCYRASDPETGRVLLAQAVEDLGVDNWCASMLLGLGDIDTAWWWRGGAWASEVTKTGWNGFRYYILSATKHFKEAIVHDAGFPEPYVGLEKVAGSGSYAGPETMYDFFHQALERQVDYFSAYGSFVWGGRPRWIGNVKDLLAFVQKVGWDARFELSIPYYAVRLFPTVLDDQRSFVDKYKRAGYAAPLDRDENLWPMFKHIYEGYLAQDDPLPEERDVLATAYFTLAWQMNQMEDLLRIAAQYPAELKNGGFEEIHGVAPAAIVDQAKVLRAAPAEWEALKVYLAGGNVTQAEGTGKIEALKAAAGSEWPTTLDEHLTRKLVIQTELEPEPDWQTLCFSVGHWQTNGLWTIGLNDSFFGRSGKYGGLFANHWAGGFTCDLAADVRIVQFPKTRPPEASIHLRHTSQIFVGLSYAPGTGIVHFGRIGNHAMTHVKKLEGNHPDAEVFRLRIQCRNGKFSAWVDGQLCFEDVEFPHMRRRGPIRPGLGTFLNDEGMHIRFEQVRVRYDEAEGDLLGGDAKNADDEAEME